MAKYFSSSKFSIFCIASTLITIQVHADAVPTHRKKTHHTSKSHAPISEADARAASVNRTKLHQKLHGLKTHMHTVRAKIHAARIKEHKITENIETVQTRLAHTRQNLNRVDNRLQTLEREHDDTVEQMHASEDNLVTRRRLLSQRLKDNYERGRTTYAHVLMQSRSVHELISRGFYVRKIVESDSELIAGIQSDLAQIREDKKKLEAQEQTQHALSEEYEQQKQQYATDLDSERELLHGVRAVRASAQEELDDLETESAEMTDRIRALSEMLRRRQEAQRAATRHSHSKGNEIQPETPEVWRGGFRRPCSARITSGFGSRFHPILHRRRIHTGVDFGAAYGSPIRAAGGGIVILASFYHGYGNCVIIDHGAGVTTLYGHASQLLVGEGQTVLSGQTIALVGSTGLATGPHLHFEVRHNGTPVQPPF